jgi:multiple sugar transport system substrate-binding protein
MQRRIMRWSAGTGLAIVAALALSACGSGFGSSSTTSTSGALTHDKSAELTVMIGSSGPAETASVTKEVAAWSKSSGIKAKVIAANNLDQQLAQGFAAKKPADVFYLATSALAGYASNGDLLSYGDQLADKSDFYPTLRSSFTYDGQLYCAPKDVSTLQLVINDDMWKAAGLTSADYPTTWTQLETVAKKLTTDGHVGLTMSPQYERLGAFMVEAGGNLMNATSTKATADSAANVEALNYAKTLLNDGVMKFSSDLGTGWGGEAFGKGLAAMTVEGNWITGAMSSDYPNIRYSVIPLPAGPAGKGTLQFSNCWGIAKDSPDQQGAIGLVKQLTSTKDQLAFSRAFGVIPSIQSAAAQWKKENPKLVPFIDGIAYAQGVPTSKGSADVVSNLDSQLGSLKTSDPKTLLEQTQKNLEAVEK